MTKIKSIIALLAAGLIAVSCGSKRQAQSAPLTNNVEQAGQTSQTVQPSPTSPTGQTKPSRSEAQWTDVYIPVRVTLTEPVSLSLSGRATMVRDKAIAINLKFLGIMDVADITVTTDSVYVVDKHHKMYFAEPLKTLLGRHQMTVGQMQDMIMGVDMAEAQTLSFANPGSDDPVTVTFSAYQMTPAGPMATDVNVIAPLKKLEVSASLGWSPDRAKWNTGRQVIPALPAGGYNRLTVANISAMLKGI